ncbi:unnamed protein product [Paramecium sonneborni]|uniref:Uncharacterized protein n=1 Tax=Paramecium sonneborni TaxID=65129 RepID=A0A8S1RH27_9CILI|nr:unnamed protein product [Paramecium sonneborni]
MLKRLFQRQQQLSTKNTLFMLSHFVSKISYEYLCILELLSENSGLNYGNIVEFHISNFLDENLKLSEQSKPKQKVLRLNKCFFNLKGNCLIDQIISRSPNEISCYQDFQAEKMKQPIKNENIISYLKKQPFIDIEQIGIVIDQ